MAFSLYAACDKQALLAAAADPNLLSWPAGASHWESVLWPAIWNSLLPNPTEEVERLGLHALQECFVIATDLSFSDRGPPYDWWYPLAGLPEKADQLAALLERERVHWGPLLKRAIINHRFPLELEKNPDQLWAKISERDRQSTAGELIDDCLYLAMELHRLEKDGHEYITMVLD